MFQYLQIIQNFLSRCLWDCKSSGCHGQILPIIGGWALNNVRHNFEYWHPGINESSGDLCDLLLQRIAAWPVTSLNFHTKPVYTLRSLNLGEIPCWSYFVCELQSPGYHGHVWPGSVKWWDVRCGNSDQMRWCLCVCMTPSCWRPDG